MLGRATCPVSAVRFPVVGVFSSIKSLQGCSWFIKACLAPTGGRHYLKVLFLLWCWQTLRPL